VKILGFGKDLAKISSQIPRVAAPRLTTPKKAGLAKICILRYLGAFTQNCFAKQKNCFQKQKNCFQNRISVLQNCFRNLCLRTEKLFSKQNFCFAKLFSKSVFRTEKLFCKTVFLFSVFCFSVFCFLFSVFCFQKTVFRNQRMSAFEAMRAGFQKLFLVTSNPPGTSPTLSPACQSTLDSRANIRENRPK